MAVKGATSTHVSTTIQRLKHLALALLAITALLGVQAFAVHTFAGQALDDAVLLEASTSPSPPEIVLASLISAPAVAVITLLLFALTGLLLGQYSAVFRAVTVCVGANVTTQALKHGLERPLLPGSQIPTSNSFPSGHATLAFTIVATVIIILPRVVARIVAPPAFIWAAVVAIGTVTAGWHRPSDVIGACVIVVAWDQVTRAAFVPRGP